MSDAPGPGPVGHATPRTGSPAAPTAFEPV